MKHKATRRIALWLFVVSVVLLISGTMAAYNRVEYVKRVVSTKNETKDFLFSSNYLYLRDASAQQVPVRMIPVSTQTDVSVTITVCNYLQNDLTRANEETITYVFTAQLLDFNGNPLTAGTGLISKLKIDNQNLDSTGTYTTTKTLTGGTAETHFYEITCSQDSVEALSGCYLQITATPQENGQRLIARLNIGSGAQSGTPWSGRFLEVTDDSQSTTNLDGFNYSISGTEVTTIQLVWNPNRVTLSQWSINMFGDKITLDENSARIQVGEDATNYTLQFYRVNGIPENETGADVRGYVTFSKVIN